MTCLSHIERLQTEIHDALISGSVSQLIQKSQQLGAAMEDLQSLPLSVDNADSLRKIDQLLEQNCMIARQVNYMAYWNRMKLERLDRA